MNKNNTEYEKGKSLPTSSMNDESKQKIAPFSNFLKLFSISILLFLTMSYISNKYIPGLFMNYIPMFFPVGKLFSKNLNFVSIFHTPLDNLAQNNSTYASQNKFFEKETIEANENNKTEATYYKLLSFGSSLINILKGGFMDLELSSELFKDIPESKIYLLDEKKLYWYHKIIVSIFGAIQIFIGPFLSLLGAFAYIFSGKVGYFLNAVKMRQKMRNEKDENIFENMETQVGKDNEYKLLFKNGGSKFNTFFNYLNFLPVDKLSYGASYFLQKEPTPGKTKYFFFIILIIILYSSFKNSNNWIISIIILIGLFIFYGKYISEPFADFKAFENIEIDGEKIKDLNTYADKRNELKKDVLKKMDEYSEEVKRKKAEYLKSNDYTD
jgi:hypothetical protein